MKELVAGTEDVVRRELAHVIAAVRILSERCMATPHLVMCACAPMRADVVARYIRDLAVGMVVKTDKVDGYLSLTLNEALL